MWHIEESSIGRLAVPPFVPPGFAVFATTRDVSGMLTPDWVAQLTGMVRERFGLDTTLTTCTQVHGASVVRAQRETTWRECDSCDALWSDERHVSLGIKVADCLPITMIDPTHSVIANVHSGWRGAAQGIALETLDAIARSTRFDVADALAYLGPSIRVCCFEVGEEVVSALDAAYGGVEEHVDRTKTRPHVDLAAITAAALRRRGFTADRIFDSGLCTRCDGSVFHSFRRDGAGGGRNLAIVAQ